MHDNQIISYNVDFKNKTILIHTYDVNEEKYADLLFRDVLTHSFCNILVENIILDIEILSIDSFIDENRDMIEEGNSYCWPTTYESEGELQSFLINSSYKYIKIYSSYGMDGWVIAKKISLI